SQIVQVSFDTNGPTIGNVYTAELIVENNDPDNPEVTISVTLTVLTSQNELVAKKIIIYPSPANQIINLQGINEIILIQIFNSSGQLIFGVENEGENIRQIDVSNLISGSYTMRFITTQNTYINHKLQIIK
ncbi:MAG TPA: T9SS type A sorting domain-containing protein, partial [Bacteroidales bacterium]|nr:T9SS type A sorting domain-containing protein [Bacteroidales bacterium]